MRWTVLLLWTISVDMFQVSCEFLPLYGHSFLPDGVTTGAIDPVRFMKYCSINFSLLQPSEIYKFIDSRYCKIKHIYWSITQSVNRYLHYCWKKWVRKFFATDNTQYSLYFIESHWISFVRNDFKRSIYIYVGDKTPWVVICCPDCRWTGTISFRNSSWCGMLLGRGLTQAREWESNLNVIMSMAVDSKLLLCSLM
jgi:hypothetical protein